MNVRDLIPWGRSRVPARHGDDFAPFLSLHREVNRLFDDFFRGAGSPLAFDRGLGWPNVEIAETNTEVRVTAELAGLEEKDVELVFANGALTIRGEKKVETEDDERRFSERYYGRFERLIPVDAEVEEDKITASFKNGLLTVTLPKSQSAPSHTGRIPINGG